MPTKLAPHLLAHPPLDEVRAMLAAWQPPVVKSLGAMSETGYLASVADVVPNAKLIQRFYWLDPIGNTDQFDLWYRTLGAQGTLDYWLSIVGGGLEAQRGNGRFYVESFNEVGMSQEYLNFETQRVYALFERFGLKSVVINTAVGTTSATDWERARAAGLLDAVRSTGSLIGLHAYAGFFMTLWHGTQNLGNTLDSNRLKSDPRNLIFRPHIGNDDPDGLQSWLAFRCRQDHEALKNLGYGDLRIVLTEFGIDNAGYDTYKNYTNGESRGGWHSWLNTWQQHGFLINDLTPERFYAYQLVWADYQLQQYPFIEGATIFTYGSDPGTLWQRFDIRRGVSDILVRILNGQEPLAIPDYNNPNAPPPETVAQPEIVVGVPTLAPTPAGPGLIHGLPTHHFVMLDGGEGGAWFFASEAARRYWEAFQPTLMTTGEYIAFLPQSVSLMVTLIATPALQEALLRQILPRWAHVGVDMVVVEAAVQLEEILASRVASQRRFG